MSKTKSNNSSVRRYKIPKTVRRLVVVFGDQLASDSPALVDFDRTQDVVWMAENAHEAGYIPNHKFRLVLFFAAMRHFRTNLTERKIPNWYHELQPDEGLDLGGSFDELLLAAIDELEPKSIVVLEPGDARVERTLIDLAQQRDIPLEILEDDYFFCSVDEFAEWTKNRKSLVLEHFYRYVRKKHDLLIDPEGKPEGGEWNFDHDNRGSFGKSGPPEYVAPLRFEPDATTKMVMSLVSNRFHDHPGSCDDFDLPVTAEQSNELLDDFLDNRIDCFGQFQDAMWAGSDELFHSRLSAAINLHLLNPHEVVERTIDRYRSGRLPIASVEGFVRQIVGWREFVRGIYWTQMPDYADENFFDHQLDVPSFFWDGNTEMACVADSMRLVHEKAYAHHIQRLMVLGLFAQMIGVHPYKFHQWHMAMYADAIDWVSLPNTLGMSQFGDGGVVGTKPYCASGAYIKKMSNHCAQCRFDPKKAAGEDACPFTTLYWDFLNRHRGRLETNRRMVFQFKNLDRKKPAELEEISTQAEALRESIYETDKIHEQWAL